MAAPTPRPDGQSPSGSSVLPAVAGAIAAVLVVGLAWLLLRGDDSDDVAVDALPTTVEAQDSTSSEPESDSSGDSETSSTTAVETTDSTTIDDVPLSDLPAGAPDTFVAVTGDTFKLVRVDSRTGEILAELGSWGLGGGGDEPLQALQMVELAPDGTIYVDDCCEPAFGSTFGVADAFDPETSPRLDGIGPELSPDGTRLARALGSVVVVSDAAGNELGVFGDPGFSGEVFSPLTWVDGSTLVVAESVLSDGNDRLVVLNVDDPNNPVEISDRSEPGRFYAAADVRADGNVLVVVRRFDPAVGSTEDDDVIAEVINPATGETVADFDLPDDVYEANYDASGRFVLTVRTNGQLDWYGAGQRGTLASGFLSADW